MALCALITGVMSIGAIGAAQAETGACFGYKNAAGSLFCFNSILESTVAMELFPLSGTLLINNVNLEVSCTGVKFVEGGALASNGSVLLGRVEFSGCESRTSSESLSKLNSCTPVDPVGGVGVIRTEKLTGLITLHFSGEPGVLFNDDPEFPEKDILAKIFLGEECAVSEEIIVTGEFVAKDLFGTESFEEHARRHLMTEHFFLHLMKVGVNQARIDGSAFVSLSGAHSFLDWGAKGA